jgi:hypothetical protein
MNEPGMRELTLELEQWISEAGVNGLLQSFDNMTREELIQFTEALGTVRQYMIAVNNRC